MLDFVRECAHLRRVSFSRRIPYNERLRELVRNVDSHRFLENPASQNTYLYQVEFVEAFSEHYFRRPLPELSILDWGCGKGHFSFLLRERGARPVSCDYRSVEGPDEDSSFGQETPILRSAGIAVDCLQDPIRLPYGDGTFDVALSFGVLEHVQNDLESLRELRRVLRPAAILFCFNLPYVCSWTQWAARRRGDFYHDNLYTRAQASRLLCRAGFLPLDIWHRQLFPKNSVRYPFYRAFEAFDQFLVRFTPLKYFATNIEFVALKARPTPPEDVLAVNEKGQVGSAVDD